MLRVYNSHLKDFRTSAGAVTSTSLATSGTLDVAKKTTLSDELNVGKTATFLGDVKTIMVLQWVLLLDRMVLLL